MTRVLVDQIRSIKPVMVNLPKVIDVAVGVICNADGNILLTQRPYHTTHAGYWEFPGGKLESLESGESALYRELLEELGITISEPQFLFDINHNYPDRTVQLHVFLIKKYHGIPQCLEGQLAMRWVAIPDLPTLTFPEANQPIQNYLIRNSKRL